MAYRSRSTSSSGRRGGSSARSGNPAAMVIAVVLVLGGVGAIVFAMSSKNKKPAPPAAPPTGGPVVVAPPVKPKPPEPPPYPPLAADKIASVKEEVKSLQLTETAKKVQGLYDEAMTAKKGGDEDTWQKKLREAASELEKVNDAWNEIVATMPSSKDYNEDEVANHYLGDEATAVNKALTLLPGIKKQIRPR